LFTGSEPTSVWLEVECLTCCSLPFHIYLIIYRLVTRFLLLFIFFDTKTPILLI
jgi:hypothetical protein